jgi:hypothetical protein
VIEISSPPADLLSRHSERHDRREQMQSEAGSNPSQASLRPLGTAAANSHINLSAHQVDNGASPTLPPVPRFTAPRRPPEQSLPASSVSSRASLPGLTHSGKLPSPSAGSPTQNSHNSHSSEQSYSHSPSAHHSPSVCPFLFVESIRDCLWAYTCVVLSILFFLDPGQYPSIVSTPDFCWSCTEQSP